MGGVVYAPTTIFDGYLSIRVGTLKPWIAIRGPERSIGTHDTVTELRAPLAKAPCIGILGKRPRLVALVMLSILRGRRSPMPSSYSLHNKTGKVLLLLAGIESRLGKVKRDALAGLVLGDIILLTLHWEGCITRCSRQGLRACVLFLTSCAALPSDVIGRQNYTHICWT